MLLAEPCRASVLWLALAVTCGLAGGAAEKDLKVRLVAEQLYIEAGSSEETRSIPDVRHPWPVRDLDEEVKQLKAAKSSGGTARSILVRDGLEFVIEASPAAAPADVPIGIYVGLFTASHFVKEDKIEEWMLSGGTPPPHNPLRMSTMFTHQSRETGGKIEADDLGDACLGEAFRGEFCARVSTCFVVAGAAQGGGRWRVAVPAKWAAIYRFEAYVGEPQEHCRPYLSPEVQHIEPAVAWWAPPVADHTASSRSMVAHHAAYARLRLLFVNRENFWWGKHAEVNPASCWLDMMQAAVNTAGSSLAAQPGQYGLRFMDSAPHGLWLEFGVGSGKTTAAIAIQLRGMFDETVLLHGFDSFQGLPSDWDHTHLAAGTFSTGGEVPEHLREMKNVQIHVGLFSETLRDLDKFGGTPVAFAHIDVDIYPSAIEVLSRIACQLYPGSVLVYDELVNYIGFELSGEYRAWEFIASAYQIGWEYAGVFWQQAVPIVITERGRIC